MVIVAVDEDASDLLVLGSSGVRDTSRFLFSVPLSVCGLVLPTGIYRSKQNELYYIMLTEGAVLYTLKHNTIYKEKCGSVILTRHIACYPTLGIHVGVGRWQATRKYYLAL